MKDVLLAIQWAAAAIGAFYYAASYSGHGWDEGGSFLAVAFVSLLLTSVPAAIRDRQFFLKYWGFGLLGLRRNFPLEWFPARRKQILNPLGWGLFGLVAFHFLLMVLTSTTGAERDTNGNADLRYFSLMVAVAGTLSALRLTYPPTETPDDYKS